MASARETNKDQQLTERTEKTRLVRYLFYISIVCVTGSGTISIQAEWLQICDAPRKQNESI